MILKMVVLTSHLLDFQNSNHDIFVMPKNSVKIMGGTESATQNLYIPLKFARILCVFTDFQKVVVLTSQHNHLKFQTQNSV